MTAGRVFKGAKVVGDIATMNQALISGEIDFHMTGGTYSASPARADGNKNIRGITPKSGPMEGGKGGISWIEVTSLVNNPELSPARGRVPEIRAGSESRPHGGLRRGHLQSGGADGQPRNASISSPRKSSTPSSGTSWKRKWRARSNTTSCRTTTSSSTS